MPSHEYYMYRALFLASKGLSAAMPNPSVGAVIVHKDTIIGEGYTSPFGGPHAEVNAIKSVRDKNLLAQSTLYVTLEPCSHYGKTPPCSDLIIENRIPHVVIGCIDPFKEVAGKGIAKLRKAGIEVTVGVLEDECKESHVRFFTYHQKKRPYIILKWAQTADGFIAPYKRDGQKPVWISNIYSRQLTHKWRSEEAAILTGTKTVLHDNPSLTTRDYFGKNPVRIYLDSELKISATSAIVSPDARTICLCSRIPENPIRGVSYRVIDFLHLSAEICRICYEEHLQSIIVEGGSYTLQQFIDSGYWDEARVFEGQMVLGNGIAAPDLKKKQGIFSKKIITDTLTLYKYF